jgi:hypothetical protein
MIQAITAVILIAAAGYFGATWLPERWLFLMLIGSVASMALAELSLRLERRRPKPAPKPQQATFDFDARQIWIASAMMAAAFAILAWTLFARGGVHQLHPLQAHAMVYATGMLLGLTLWLPRNLRKLASK